MNIFVLDESPTLAAQMHCDKHVPKMVLETAQILSTVLHDKEFSGRDKLYKPTHVNHPCVRWAAESFCNFLWTLSLGLALGKEYHLRYGPIHKSTKTIRLVSDISYKELSGLFDQDDMTDWALAMPDKFKCDDAVHSYREYYREEKSRFAVWHKGRDEPHWWASAA